MKLAIMGAGAWGTALAIQAGHRHPTVLWARDTAQADAMRQQRVNARYLPEAGFSEHLEVRSGPLGDWLQQMALVVLAGPMASLRPMLQALHASGQVRCPVAKVQG